MRVLKDKFSVQGDCQQEKCMTQDLESTKIGKSVHTRSSVSQAASFLLYLLEERQCKARTAAGYMPSITTIHSGTISNNADRSKLITEIFNISPNIKPFISYWGLPTVLWAL